MATEIKKLKLGIIGLSEGNGHPYSWAAIFNGFNKEEMAKCPFPVIPEYLSQQNYPEDFLGHLGEVTHVWTQDRQISGDIASAARISNVCQTAEEMIPHVDAVLLARDDAENHYKMALPFLKAGLPVFIDKPLALSCKEAEAMFNEQQYENQIFTCSSLRYAEELRLTDTDLETIGELKFLEASVMKKWDTYAVHIIEPIVAMMPGRGELLQLQSMNSGEFSMTLVKWKNLQAFFKVTGKIPVPLEYKFYGTLGSVTKTFKDSFACFKASLKKFTEVVNNKSDNIHRTQTLEIIKIIEGGRQ